MQQRRRRRRRREGLKPARHVRPSRAGCNPGGIKLQENTMSSRQKRACNKQQAASTAGCHCAPAVAGRLARWSLGGSLTLAQNEAGVPFGPSAWWQPVSTSPPSRLQKTLSGIARHIKRWSPGSAGTA
ncbi:predicted protein [Uncinocarpus reesii 1704]|uniref:Uncharacterized protein n=1 Tax=Uncinocarpus reesii (strain UAMH 1704) TaxID=336963 RepID=C4JZ53_UNCRE|nr:uncharacterized protein UREG_07454 [Uncinocarpus reesii 1704]EEP82589.1 predicted protein [Uncinocarpus reesii 1704]